MATGGEPDPNTSAILDWLGDSLSFIPPFLRDPYESSAIDEIDCPLWDPFQEQNHNHLNNIPNTTTITPTNSTPQPSPPLPTPPSEQQSKLSKKRKQNQPNTQTTNSSDGDNTEEIEEIKRKPKKPNSKANNGVGNCGNGCGTNKDSRWAEQLLLPCATAIDAGDLSRVQHLLYVLNEVASPSGDANHRLAWHGFQSLTHHLALNTVTVKTASASTFASMDPSAFRAAIFKFNEVSPWFAFPNSLANSAILQTLGGGDFRRRSLHIVDIGVSHGVQWPTLLEALTRRPGGPPSLVRLTIVSATPTEPFAAAPAGYDSSSHLLRYAKSIDLNLEISRIDTLPATLDRETLATSADETLIVCAQFRLHHLNHFPDDERTAFLQSVADLSPRLVVVSENDGDCGGSGCGCGGGGFARGFGAWTEYMWGFLDSTSAAYKGRESEERRAVEAEAAVEAEVGMGEREEGWRWRLEGVGMEGVGFGEEAVETAKGMLRKYDSGWEMRAEERERGLVRLCWKGRRISFCSLWTTTITPRQQLGAVDGGGLLG